MLDRVVDEKLMRTDAAGTGSHSEKNTFGG